jgi:hypothetical protein
MLMLYKMSVQGRKSALPPSLPLLPRPYSHFSYLLFGKLADRHKCAQPIGEIFPPRPLSLHKWRWITDYGDDYEIKWVIVNSGIGAHITWQKKMGLSQGEQQLTDSILPYGENGESGPTSSRPSQGCQIGFGPLQDSGFPRAAEQWLGLVRCETVDFQVLQSSGWVWSAARQWISRHWVAVIGFGPLQDSGFPGAE